MTMMFKRGFCLLIGFVSVSVSFTSQPDDNENESCSVGDTGLSCRQVGMEGTAVVDVGKCILDYSHAG